MPEDKATTETESSQNSPATEDRSAQQPIDSLDQITESQMAENITSQSSTVEELQCPNCGIINTDSDAFAGMRCPDCEEGWLAVGGDEVDIN